MKGRLIIARPLNRILLRLFGDQPSFFLVNKYLLFVFLSTLLIACKEEDSPTGSGPVLNPITSLSADLPYETIDSWKYLHSNGDTIVFQTAGNDTIDGKIVNVVVQSLISGGPDTVCNYSYYYKDNDFLYLYEASGKPTGMYFKTQTSSCDTSGSWSFNGPQKILKYPTAPGAMWNSEEWNGTATRQYEKFEYVTTPAGTFQCIKILISPIGSTTTLSQWVAPQGLIKQSINGSTVSSWELVEID